MKGWTKEWTQGCTVKGIKGWTKIVYCRWTGRWMRWIDSDEMAG
jgi:hypothetical protein